MEQVEREIAAVGGGAEESDKELLAQLRQLHGGGTVAIRTSARRHNHMDSPIGVEADANIWVYGFLAVAGLLWWLAGLEAALIAAGVGTVAYFTLGRLYVKRRLDQRVREKALQDVTQWRKLWRFGGVTLVAAGEGGAECRAPDDNWMAFVRALAVREARGR